MEEKYIELLLNKCANLNKSKILFIHYQVEIKDFIIKLVNRAKELGVQEVYYDEKDPYKTHDVLANITLEEIEKSDFFDESHWDTYAKKNANFLIFETEYPHLMDDIDSKKVALSARRRRESRPIYRKMVENCELSWCIAAYPGKIWAEDIYKSENSYQKLKDAIYKMCMVDSEDPLNSWEQQLQKNAKIINKLNQLGLVKLHYSNQLGTSLEVFLPENYLFESAKDNEIIVNMPSYEIFTSPIYNKTNGIVYSSMPLIYNGSYIDKFWLEFKDGKVINFDAKIGKDILKEIIEADSNSCYLGECALVEKSSPIASMNKVFGTTLIDENASCHLALGAGFPECIKDGIGLEEYELLKLGINVSKTHVDFMIGTSDMNIVGTTKNGEEVIIFKDGNFSVDLLK